MTMTTTLKRQPSTPEDTTPDRGRIADWLRPGDAPPELAALNRLRRIFLAFALFNCVTVIPIAFVSSRTTLHLRIAAFASIIILGARWIHGYRKRSFSWPLLDVVEGGALLAAGLAVGRPENAIGFFYAAIMFRSLYGSRTRARAHVLLFLGAFVTVVLLSGSEAVVSGLLAPVFGLLFTAMISRVIAETLSSHGRALKRERILRQLGGMLGRFRDDKRMRTSVLAALSALEGDDPATRVSIAQGSADNMAVVAVAGSDAESVQGKRCDPSKLPPTLFEALRDNHVVRPTLDESALVAINFVGKKHGIMAPLVVADQLIGLLSLASNHALPADLDEVVAILAAQVSMWLEGQHTDSLLRERDRERARLLRHLVLAQEDERKLIAGDIHDDSIQEMSAVAIRLGMLRKHLNDDGALETLTKIEGSVTSSIGRLRSLMFRLRPPALDEGGLAPALREQLSEIAGECGFTWEVNADMAVEPSAEVCVPAFRIAQEALANVRKHAQAQNVSITATTKDGGVRVIVRDDGVGFCLNDHPPEIGHLGVTSMRERAEICGGTYSIASAPGKGTTVEFWIPESLDIPEASV